MQNATVLAIDDNELNLRVIAASLSDFHVVSHCNPATALERFEEVRPHLVILDLVMPVIDGFELCRQIRGHEKLGDTPILFLSARNDTEAIVRGFQAGCNDYVTKPFVREELCARVQAHIRLRSADAQRLALQQNLFLAARQISLATLAAGMSHEINNPLAILMGTLEKLEATLASSPDLHPHIERMQRALHRIENVVSLLRSFASLSSTDTRVDLCDLIEKTLGIFHTLVTDNGASLEVALNCPKAMLPGTTESFEFVLTTLISNAVDAVAQREGGLIGIELAERPTEFVLNVSDNGCGMSPDQQRQLFIPFFTTKAPGRGLGLGLAVSHRIVHAIGGRIEVQSSAGAGSTFSVIIPKTQS